MAIKKALVLESTGAPVSYHVVGNVSIDATAKVTIATVQSYVSEEAFKAGKLPLQGGQSISVSGMPKDNEGAFAYVQKRLVEPKPEGDSKTTDVSAPYGTFDRYMFADGEIVA
ncbi:hypothetical protein WL68_02590 [Burkholderia cepacia]|uniref:hypothetical protein n=1 Tax=Burkholderia cepacia TaxID=292 RepID=UPI00075E2134|nr:hypothetical protein [Burkholderia cepacia]KWD57233.1 hypothetical protein WL68_02590 [Burkholderia cepacia]KWD83096.1 hypothetical protein WL69_15625 [Burkholderia cepacia]